MFWFTVSAVLAVLLITSFMWWSTRYYRVRSELRRCRREAEQREQDEEALASERASQQRALFDSMVEGVLILNADNQVQLVNASLRRLLGIEEDVRGRSLMEAFRLHELAEVLERLRDEGRVTEFELRSGTGSGRVLQLNAVVLPDVNAGQPGAMLVFHDLTRIKQLENGRREFVANVSHELRTPLSMIKGYVETLLDGALTDESVSKKFLKTIDRHADRLMFLIEDLLTISSLESGQVSVNAQRLAIDKSVNRVVEDLRARAEARGVTMESGVPEKLHVMADQSRLQQVLFNLVDNAIKYGRQDGTVRIGARVRDDGFAEVSVSDDGPGIPADAVNRVFERFYRVDKARSREQGGTGLGLAIVKHIVHAHDGEVWVTSPPGEGSTFHFTLRLAD